MNNVINGKLNNTHKNEANKIFRYLFILLLAPTSVMILYDCIFYYIPMFEKNYTSISIEYLIFMVFVDILSLFIFIHFFFKQNKNTEKTEHNFPYISNKWYFFISVTIFILINYLVIHTFGTINYSAVIKDYGRFYAVSKRGTAWVFYLINILTVVLLYDLYLNKFTKTKLFFIISIIMMIACTGGRGNVMIMVLFLVFIHVVIHRKHLNILVFLLSLSLILTFFVANSVLRAKTDLITYLETKKSAFDFDQAFTLNDVIEKQDKDLNTYLIDMVDFTYMFIPRKLWKEKPMSTAATRLVYPEIANRGTSITFGLYANILMNIGYLMFLFIPVFIFFFTYLYFKAIDNKKPNFISFIIVYFSVNSIQLIRGGVLDTRVFRIFISLYLSYWLFKFISSRVKKYD